MAAAVSQAAAAGVLASTSNDTAGQVSLLNDTEQQSSSDTAGSTVESSQGRALVSTGSHKQQNDELDPDQMAMRLALDVLWTGAQQTNQEPNHESADVASS